MFWFLLLGLLLVIGGVTLAVVKSGVGEGDGRVSGGLGDPVPERLAPAMPEDRPLARSDVDTLRLPLGLRGYRMEEVDDVLDRLGAELSERDARIAELEAALAGSQAAALGRQDLFAGPSQRDDAQPGGATAAGGPEDRERLAQREELADWDAAQASERDRELEAGGQSDETPDAQPRSTGNGDGGTW